MTGLRKWPKRAAIIYAVFGFFLFAGSCIKPYFPDNTPNYFWADLLFQSYPYAKRASLSVSFAITHHTPLSSMEEKVFADEQRNTEYPRNTSLAYKFFSQMITPYSPYRWLVRIIIGSLFYYLLTRLIVLAIERWRKPEAP